MNKLVFCPSQTSLSTHISGDMVDLVSVGGTGSTKLDLRWWNMYLSCSYAVLLLWRLNLMEGLYTRKLRLNGSASSSSFQFQNIGPPAALHSLLFNRSTPTHLIASLFLMITSKRWLAYRLPFVSLNYLSAKSIALQYIEIRVHHTCKAEFMLA